MQFISIELKRKILSFIAKLPNKFGTHKCSAYRTNQVLVTKYAITIFCDEFRLWPLIGCPSCMRQILLLLSMFCSFCILLRERICFCDYLSISKVVLHCSVFMTFKIQVSIFHGIKLHILESLSHLFTNVS